jgi:tetratricopeptide (TPR) repeat protein
VAWVSGRADLLTAFLALACTLRSIRAQGWRGQILVTLFYFAALLSKETAIALLVVLPLLDVVLRRPWQWQREVFLLGATLLYFALRNHSVGAPIGGYDSELHLGEALSLWVRALGLYTAHALVPGLVNPYIGEIPTSPLYAVVLAVTVAGVALLFRVAQAQSRRLLSFFVLWFFAFVLPVTAVLFRKSAVTLAADRYLYLPSLSACLLLAWVLLVPSRVLRLPYWLRHALFVLLATISAVRALSYSSVWRDNATFWSAAHSAAPQDPVATRELGLVLLDRGDTEQAKALLEAALRLSRTPEEHAMAASNLASVYRRAGDWARALRLLERAIASAPHPALFHNLGLTHMGAAEEAQRAQRNTEVVAHVLAARDAFERALAFARAADAAQYRSHWDPAKTHSLLGQVYWSLGERERAREHLLQALRLATSDAVATATRRYWQQAFPNEPTP